MSLYRIRNFIIAVVMILLAFILESSVFSKLPLVGCAPDLILIITFIYGYTNGKIPGMLAGFFGGLIIDVFYCNVIGFNALVLLFIGFVSGIWNSYFYSDDLYIPLLMITGSDFCYCLVYFAFWFGLRNRLNFGFYLIHEILPELLLTFAAALIIYKPITLFLGKLKYVPEE